MYLARISKDGTMSDVLHLERNPFTVQAPCEVNIGNDYYFVAPERSAVVAWTLGFKLAVEVLSKKILDRSPVNML